MNRVQSEVNLDHGISDTECRDARHYRLPLPACTSTPERVRARNVRANLALFPHSDVRPLTASPPPPDTNV